MKKPPEHPPLDSAFELLLDAIVRDDRKKVTALLKREPDLALQRVDQPRLYQGQLGHWLYAKDTALHLAAAGHRCEIAGELIKMSAEVNAAQNMPGTAAALRRRWMPGKSNLRPSPSSQDDPVAAQSRRESRCRR